VSTDSAASDAPGLAAECRRLAAALAEAHDERARAQAQLRRYVEDLLLVNRERKVALDAARHSARAQSRFLGSVSHELRAPMTTIVGFAELLARDPDAADRADSAERIRRAALRLNAHVDRLIEAGRHGDAISTPAPVIDLAASLGGAVQRVRQAAGAAGREITLWLPPHPVPLACDGHRLGQALVALIDEAARGAPAAPIAVRLEADTDGRSPALVVSVGAGTIAPTAVASEDAVDAEAATLRAVVDALLDSVGAQLTRQRPSEAGTVWKTAWNRGESDI